MYTIWGFFINWVTEITFKIWRVESSYHWKIMKWTSGFLGKKTRWKHRERIASWQTEENYIWTASSEFGTYRLCEQRRFRRACASAQSRQNLRCSLIQAVSQEEPSDRKPDPWSLWMAGHAQLKFVMTECSKTQIRLTGLSSNNENWSIRAPALS